MTRDSLHFDVDTAIKVGIGGACVCVLKGWQGRGTGLHPRFVRALRRGPQRQLRAITTPTPAHTHHHHQVCRSAGYHEHALYVALAAGEPATYLDILLEDCGRWGAAQAPGGWRLRLPLRGWSGRPSPRPRTGERHA